MHRRNIRPWSSHIAYTDHHTNTLNNTEILKLFIFQNQNKTFLNNPESRNEIFRPHRSSYSSWFVLQLPLCVVVVAAAQNYLLITHSTLLLLLRCVRMFVKKVMKKKDEKIERESSGGALFYCCCRKVGLSGG